MHSEMSTAAEPLTKIQVNEMNLLFLFADIEMKRN